MEGCQGYLIPTDQSYDHCPHWVLRDTIAPAMGKPRTKKPPPPQLTPPIDPDALFSPLLLKYVQTLRNENYIYLAEKFDVPYTWDYFELSIIHLKIRELLKYGSFDTLARFLKGDPRCMVHPVIMNQTPPCEIIQGA